MMMGRFDKLLRDKIDFIDPRLRILTCYSTQGESKILKIEESKIYYR